MMGVGRWVYIFGHRPTGDVPGIPDGQSAPGYHIWWRMQAMKNPPQPPGKVPHQSGMRNPDGTDAAAARDAAAAIDATAARDAAAAAAAGDEAAAGDRDVTVPSAYTDEGTGRPCMLMHPDIRDLPRGHPDTTGGVHG